MFFEEGYQKYIVLAEENATTDGLSTDKSRFKVNYNIAQNKVMEWLVENNKSDENRYLQKIKVPQKELVKLAEKSNYTSFEIPKDYFDFINLDVYGKKGKCSKQYFKATEVKGSNINTLLIDSNRKPDFSYRETIYTISQDSVQVYKDNFDIDSASMYYYRYPTQVELEDPDNPESNFLNKEFEFDDKLTNRILFLSTALHELSENDPKYKAHKQETIQKF